MEAGGRRALDDVTATIAPGGVTVVTGPSGSGKSTLLRLCNRLEVPTSGRVLFRDDDVASIDPLVLRRRVGMVFQRPTLFGGTVRDNMLVARPEGSDDHFLAALGRAALPDSFLDRPADELSGGEAQRVCLARTLVTGPEVLLMDEPTSSLDDVAKRSLEGLARGEAARGVAVLWVTHEREQARRIADDVLALDSGRVAGR